MNDRARASVREVIRDEHAAAGTKRRNLWALIVGISEYQDKDWNLEFADADAEALYQQLIDPRCGGYPAHQICKLTNAQATKDAIWDGLRTFLQQPAPEDFVLVFFACHGGPDPNRPRNLYVFPHDTDPKRISATAIPMEYVQDALSPRNLLAECVVLLADTCHAGGMRAPHHARGAADAMNRFIAEMANSRPGMATLTATEEREVAWEGTEWGEGHGVFTHFLLEGLTGGAARPEDGVVTVGQLFDYVRNKVIEATSPDRTQHPSATLNADTRQWPMVVLSDLLSDERYLLGRAMSAIGQRLGDDRRLAAAIDEHEVSIAYSQKVGRALPAARYEIGRCRLAMADFTSAMIAFAAAAADARAEAAAGRDVPGGLTADIAFWSWAAALQARDDWATQRAAARFAEDHGADPRLPLIETMSRVRDLRRHALLIGVDRGHRGPANDVAAMRRLLLDCGYDDRNIQVLDSAAATTRGAILEAVAAFRTTIAADDEALIYFAGESVRGSLADGSPDSAITICTSDFDAKKRVEGIQPDELHHALEALQHGRVLVVLDSCYSAGLFEQPRTLDAYMLLSGTSYYEVAEEAVFDGEPRGRFTAALVSAIRGLAARQPQELLEVLRTALVPFRQTPWFRGGPTEPVIEHLQEAARIATALRYAEREYLGGCTREDLDRLATGLPPEMLRALPALRDAIGRACLDRRMHKQAVEVFDTAGTFATEPSVAQLGVAIGLSHLGDYGAVERAVDASVTLLEPGHVEQCRAALARLQRGRAVRALIVGVSRTDRGYEQNLAVLNDVTGMRRVLEQVCGSVDIDELIDEHATRDAILARFAELVRCAAEVPCVFFFAGPGNRSGEPAIATHVDPRDWRRDGIELRELAELAGPTTRNLTTIIDAGWVAPTELPWSMPDRSRCEANWQGGGTPPSDWVVPAPPRPVVPPRAMLATRDVEPVIDRAFVQRRARRAAAVAHLGIGGVTIYTPAILMRTCPDSAEPGENVLEAELLSPWTTQLAHHGVLTHTLVDALLQPGALRRSYRQLQAMSAERLQWLQPVFIGTAAEERFLANILVEDEFERTIRKVSLDRPVFEAIDLLRARLRRLAGMEEGPRKRQLICAANRELGIAYLLAGEIDGAIEALRAAVDDGGAKDPDVRAYLGRALLEQGADLDAAILHLQEAIALWKADAAPVPAYVDYYYGRALRERMESQRREDLERLGEAWQRYLAAGAPLGGRGEIQDFLARTWSADGPVTPRPQRS